MSDEERSTLEKLEKRIRVLSLALIFGGAAFAGLTAAAMVRINVLSDRPADRDTIEAGQLVLVDEQRRPKIVLRGGGVAAPAAIELFDDAGQVRARSAVSPAGDAAMSVYDGQGALRWSVEVHADGEAYAIADGVIEGRRIAPAFGEGGVER